MSDYCTDAIQVIIGGAMNTNHLQQIIDNYLAGFEDFNGPVHREYYKWQIAYKFRTLLDDALNASDEDFSEKLYTVKRLTENLIDSYTTPFNGLVEYSKIEPQTVRQMFKELLEAAALDVNRKQDAIWDFLGRSHSLRDKYFPGTYLYNDDLHSVTSYLFLYDPDHNYLYKASHCRSFADCIEFYDDWGYGADTKLAVFYRMCDEVLSLIKENEPLMAANAGRYDIDPNGMHPDQEKHILLFDLIYCCTSYGLFKEISYVTPKTGERKLMQERKERAQELAAKLAEAQEQLEALNTATEWLQSALQEGTPIQHKSFGEGVITELTDKAITVQFSGVGKKTLGTLACVSNGLLRFNDEEKQAILLQYKGILSKDKQIRNNVQWAEQKLIPYAEYLG